MPVAKPSTNLVLAIALTFVGFSTSPVQAATLTGTVKTGGNLFSFPLPRTKVTLFEATTSQPTPIGTTTTNMAGRFTITSKPTSNSIFFAVADLGKSVQLITILGPNLPSHPITINELTTVAASYSMAQFFRTGVISGNAFALQIATQMNDNLVEIATGQPSLVMSRAPNADQTNSLRSIRSLANMLAACTANRALAAYFLTLTTPPGGPAPTTTPQGLANLARDPGMNVLPIYLLTKVWIPYFPGLILVPDAWTVTVKVNDSGSDAFPYGGPANIAFDAKGYAWVTNNVIQGQPYSTPSVIVLKPNGKPSDGTNGTPVSPITTGGLLGTGFGVSINSQGIVWFGNFGWGGDNPTPTTNGSVSAFFPNGNPLSPPTAFQGGPVRAQGLAVDASDNVWIASFGTDSIFVFPKGDPKKSVGSPPLYTGAQCFDIQIAKDGTTWVVSGGGFTGEYQSNVSRFAFANGNLTQLSSRQFPAGRAMKGISLDSLGNAWVASQGDSKIYVFAPNGNLIASFGGTRFTSGGINGPWSVTVDGEDNVWVANFGPLQSGSNFTDGRVSKLAGANPATRPKGKNLGDPISPWTGYTVPTAFSPVLLHNGDPLYGPGAKPSFAPLMRLTNTVIDQAGNLWALNNWKPDFDVDTRTSPPGNPGGDGIVIFVGLAPPKRLAPIP